MEHWAQPAAGSRRPSCSSAVYQWSEGTSFANTRPAFRASRERAMADQTQWHFSGDYFENCSCTVVCPCLVSTAAPLTARPTEGVCNVPLIFHIETGRYGETK